MACKQVYEDSYGSVIDHIDEGFIEIRWYDTTVEMSSAEFRNWLIAFTNLVDKLGARQVLVDAISFRMDGTSEIIEWRDREIIPRFNESGVKKFAFHLPAGVSRIGSMPAPEGSADFPTGYFATRAEATEWLAI